MKRFAEGLKIRRGWSKCFVLSVVLIQGNCESKNRDAGLIPVVMPTPGHPYLIVSADKSDVRSGELVEIDVTFVNPTKRRVVIPTSVDLGKESLVGYQLTSNWVGSGGETGSGFAAVALNVCPPGLCYLEPGGKKTFRLEWKSDCRGKGVVTLTCDFNSGSDFPDAEIRLTTR